MSIVSICSKSAIPTGGHYTQAIAAGGLIFVSGQLGVTSNEEQDTLVETQTHRVLSSLRNILTARGADLASVAKVTIYVADIGHWPVIDTIYSDFFRGHKPARAIVPVPELHYGAAIELEAIAVDLG